MSDFTFDATTEEPNQGFEAVPAGNYTAVITAADMKETKAKNGAYLELTFQIVSGQYQNRNVWERLNLINQNEATVRYARGDLCSICRAVGVGKLADLRNPIELLNLPMIIKVETGEYNGKLTNEIKGYEAATQAAALQPAATAGSVPPWKQ